MAWSLIPQGRSAPTPSPVRLQISRAGRSDKKLLGVLLAPEVMIAAGMKPGDFVTLHLGQGTDHGWLRLDLASEAPDSRILARVAGSPSSSVKFTLDEPTLEPTVSNKALTWEAKPGSLFVSVPPPLMGLFVAPRAATVAASGLVPLYSCGKTEPQEDLAPPPAEDATPPAAPEQDLGPAPEVEAEQRLEAPPPAPAAAPARVPVGKESPDELKPEAMQMFAAGMNGRAVADDIGVSLTLVSQWKQEFDLSRKAAVKRRAA